MEEIWKPIPGFEGLYEVSNLGNFKTKGGRPGNWNEKLIKLTIQHDGYLRAGLSKENKRCRFNAHRIVANVFIPNLENKPHVNHINSIRSDNRVENLEWVTPKENTQHAIKCGRFKPSVENLLKNRSNFRTLLDSVCHPGKEAVGIKNLCKICYMKDLRKSKKLKL